MGTNNNWEWNWDSEQRKKKSREFDKHGSPLIKKVFAGMILWYVFGRPFLTKIISGFGSLRRGLRGIYRPVLHALSRLFGGSTNLVTFGSIAVGVIIGLILYKRYFSGRNKAAEEEEEPLEDSVPEKNYAQASSQYNIMPQPESAEDPNGYFQRRNSYDS